jgi:hypothetical protein
LLPGAMFNSMSWVKAMVRSLSILGINRGWSTQLRP